MSTFWLRSANMMHLRAGNERQLRRYRIELALRKLVIATSQIVLITLTFYTSFQLRFEFALDMGTERQFLHALPFAVLTKLSIFYFFGLLRGWWRYAGISDLLDITKAAVISSSVLYALFLGLKVAGAGFPRSIMIIDWILTILVIGGARFAVRAYTDSVKTQAGKKNTLIVGAGSEGTSIIRELRQNPQVDYNPVAVIDDDVSKLGVKIHGIKVVGSTEILGEVIDHYGIQCVMIATQSPDHAQLHRIIEGCRTCKVEFKILPKFGDWINGGSSLARLREVNVEDLLGRAPVRLNVSALQDKLQGKVVLITGAAGSIGSELVRKVANFQPAQVVLFDRSENDQFKLSLELTRRFSNLNFVTIIGDVLDVGTLRDVFGTYRPHSVFHAAAYKHVPMMEQNCFQAITNNVFGTYNVALVARQFNTRDFVLISTDKAVNPTNIMGVTKRVCELIVLGLQQQETKFVAVRFGNVMGSNGSVLPIFEQQIRQGGPVTVTHADATRYFMTIPEAVQLVLQASTMGKGGEIFVLDMGEPVRIMSLAQNLIRLSGLQPEVDIRVEVTGLRPGEKLFEELARDAEGTKQTTHEKISVLDGGFVDFQKVRRWLDSLSALVLAKNMGGLVKELMAIVPEYRPSEHVLARCEVDCHDIALHHGLARAQLVNFIDDAPPKPVRSARNPSQMQVGQRAGD
jgi:FlaA1/EpsC-like NDP-sugar epimerase